MDYAASAADIEAPALPSSGQPYAEMPQGSSSATASQRRRHRGPEQSLWTRICVISFASCGCCTAVFCILAPLAWIPFAFIIWAKHSKEPCDQPLPSWLESYILFTLLLPYIRGRLTHALCGWTPEEDGDSPPRRVKIFYHSLEVVPIFWMIYARVLLSRSHTCKDTCQTLFHFVDWYSWFMLLFMTLRLVGAGIGMSLFQIWVARNGDFSEWMQTMLQKANAASPDTITKIETVAYEPTLFADPSDLSDGRPAGECCICLQSYDADMEIKRTLCGHYCHTSCLEEWLRRARTCPTCRKDLEEACEEDSSVVDLESAPLAS